MQFVQSGFVYLVVFFSIATSSEAVVFEITLTGERGALANVPVQLTPSDGDDTMVRSTDSEGRVKFEFKSCKFVDVWVDMPQGNVVDVPSMCGNFDHRTSVYLRNMAYGSPVIEAYKVAELLEDLRSRYGRGPLSLRAARQIRGLKLKQKIENATKPEKDDDDETREEKGKLRTKLLKELSQLTPNPLD